jgi:hypothetical protein
MSGDPVRESGTTTNYSVFGEIVSYRPAVNNFVLSVDGTDRNVDFNVTDLEETAAVSNMTVFASGVVSLSDGKKRVEVRVTNSSGQTVENDTIRLDGDGLKPSVEENVTQTDPFDPDSDSAVTSTDESGDGTVDGREDFDDDGLVTKNEIRFDTDPFDEDSDSDQLQDGFEVSNGFDPLSNDTNNDSTLDPDWDPDSDSLDNLQEQNLGTNPRLPDTDADNLNDSVEVNVHNTDPVDEDTDNDTILDGNEIRLGTDPLSDDSDGDGTPDGSETYTSTKENEQLGVGVDITGEGYVAKNVSIGSTGNVEFPSGKTTDSYISQAVDIESPDAFDSANISFSYNESNYQNESNITIVRYNETTGKYDAVETEIDEQANTAKANVSHFSVYGIMDLDPVADLIRKGGVNTGATDLTGWKLKDKCCHNETDPFEINLSDYGSVAPGEVVRIETTEEYDSAMWNNDKGDTIRLIDDSGNIVDSESYNGSEATEGTVLDDFSTTKGEMSISSARPNANGDDNLNPSREYVEITYTANSTTCGFSESVRDLDRLLVAPQYLFLGGESDGPELDSTEPDCDTDKDGLKDKTELGESFPVSDTLAEDIAKKYSRISEKEAKNTEIAFAWESNPLKDDTDGDGVDDWTEVQEGTNRLEKDTDDDGLNDKEDPLPSIKKKDSGAGFKEGFEFVQGAVLGETGASGGAFKSDAAESPYYLAGWITGSVVPVVDIVADSRDFAQNLANGKETDAALDASGLIPIIGKVGDGAKVADVAKDWAKNFPSKTKAASRVGSRIILKHAPDSINKKFFKALGYGNEHTQLINDGLTPGNVEDLVNNLPRKAGSSSIDDVLEATVRVEDGEDIVIGLTKGSDELGWKHIEARHVGNTPNGADDFLRGADDSVEPDDVNDLIMEAAEDGTRATKENIDAGKLPEYSVDDADSARIVYKGVPDEFNFDRMRVITDGEGDGAIISAYPVKTGPVP